MGDLVTNDWCIKCDTTDHEYTAWIGNQVFASNPQSRGKVRLGQPEAGKTYGYLEKTTS